MNIIPVGKSRRMRWAGRVTRMGEMRNVYSVLVEYPERKELNECPWKIETQY
jgi:hypothetical protein